MERENDTERQETTAPEETEPERVWLVERTVSDDEQNLIVLVYATTDGTRYFRKERAHTSATDTRETTAALEVEPANLGAVEDEETASWYASEASRMAEDHEPDDAI